jgi:hypothetical protein
MRKALNDNPMVQLAVLGALLVGVGLIFATSVMKKDRKTEDSTPSGADAILEAQASGALPAAGSSAPTLPDSSVTPAPATSGDPAAADALPPAPDSLIPGPGLPAEVVAAWKGGDAVVLLIVRNKGVDDRLVRGSVSALEGDPEVTVFVAKARDVARYSRITQGVGLNRVPALVVIRPRRLSGSVPQAQVSYGFRSSESVVQAVEDALYSGRDNVPYYPES